MAKSKLEELAIQAAKAEAAVHELQGQSAALSPKGFVRAYSEIAGADMAEAKRVLAALSEPQNKLLQPSFRRLSTAMGGIQKTSAIRHYPYIDEDGNSTLARLGCTRESFALACALALVERYKNDPDYFGDQDVPGAQQVAVERAVRHRDKLMAELNGAWTKDDVTMLPVTTTDRDRGFVRLGVTFTNNEVFVGDDLAAHLVSWVRVHQRHKAAA
jgi:hypothetical protein